MIVVALDNSEPTSREDLSWGAWVGDGRNRWYDKHQRKCVFHYDNLRRRFFLFFFLPAL